LIDTHCHVDQFDSPESVALAAEQNRIFTIAVTNLPSHYRIARERLAGLRYVTPALGMHPLAARQHATEMPLFHELVASAHFIGEVGLDFSPQGRRTADEQIATFEEVIRSVVTPFRVVTLHSRGAEGEVLSCLERNGAGPMIFHWFSGPKRLLEQVVAAGHYIAINPAMISTQKWQRLAQAVPRDRILTETDGPFAKQNAKPAVPLDVKYVIEWLAAQWHCSLAETEIIVKQNFAQLRDGPRRD
jgi:TatD DNase family protein